MKKFKKVITLVVALTLLLAVGIVYADSPSEIVSGITGKSVDELYAERSAGKTYGTIASEAGKLEEFKAQMLEQRKITIDQRVADGVITQERADEMYSAMAENQALCDGTGGMGMGKEFGVGFGKDQGLRDGNGFKNGGPGNGGFGRGR